MLHGGRGYPWMIWAYAHAGVYEVAINAPNKAWERV